MSFEEWVDSVMNNLPSMERVDVNYQDKTIEISESLYCSLPTDDDPISGIRFEECMDDQALEAENITIKIEFECEDHGIRCEADYKIDMLENDGRTWVTVKVDGSKPRPDSSSVVDMVWTSFSS